MFVANGHDTHLLGREPEGEIAGVMLDEEADEALVGTEWRAVNAQRRFLGVVAVLVNKAKTRGHRKIHLIRRDGEFPPDRAPDLHIDLWPVEGGFVRNLNIVNARFDKDLAHHVLGFFPEDRIVHEFHPELGRVVGGESHDILIDAEDLEVLEIHLVHGAEFLSELLFRAIDVRVVHLHRAHAHEAKELTALLVAIAGAVLRQP